MKTLVSPSFLDAEVAEVEGEKSGRWPVLVLLSFLGWHIILMSFMLTQRHTARDGTY